MIVVESHTLCTYAAVQSGSQVLHIIVEKVNKLLVCQQMVLWYHHTALLQETHLGPMQLLKMEVTFFTSL